MEIFLVIVLVIVIFTLWRINKNLVIIGNSLFQIENNLSDLNNKFNSPGTGEDDFES